MTQWRHFIIVFLSLLFHRNDREDGSAGENFPLIEFQKVSKPSYRKKLCATAVGNEILKNPKKGYDNNRRKMREREGGSVSDADAFGC